VPAFVNKCYNTLGFSSEYANMNLNINLTWHTSNVCESCGFRFIHGFYVSILIKKNLVMPKNRPGPAGVYKLCHMWIKRLLN